MSAYGNQFDSTGCQYLWNASALKDWEKCPRYYQYRWIDGLSREESVHLTFGSHYAWALMRFFQLRAEGMDRAEARESVVASLLDRTWITKHEPDGSHFTCKHCGAELLGDPPACTGRPGPPI